MTTFSRYYEDGLLHETTMNELEELIKDESNKALIADLIYHRYYDRYLKIFDYKASESKVYVDEQGNEKVRSIFNLEYKNGFVMLASCCLLIETMASFLNGNDTTPKDGGVDAYISVFKKAFEYDNELKIFRNETIYGSIRCAILHQGEIKDGFKIRRTGKLFEDKTINANEFLKSLKMYLKSYCDDLSNPDTEWDGDLWEKCKSKLVCIITNTKNI